MHGIAAGPHSPYGGGSHLLRASMVVQHMLWILAKRRKPSNSEEEANCMVCTRGTYDR